jgi:hypothetical protein
MHNALKGRGVAITLDAPVGVPDGGQGQNGDG